MKKLKVALMFLMSLGLTFAAGCSMLGGGGSSESESVDVSSESVLEESTPEDSSSEGETQYETITIAEALEICGEPGNVTEERYYIRAIVQSITNPQYGAMIIEDETGSIPVYGTYSADGAIGYAAMTEKPYKGDEVLLHCILQNYNGTKEVKNARLIEFKSNAGNVDESAYTEMSIAEARAAAKGDLVKVDGVVAAITYANGMKPSGVMLVDETQSIYVYDADLAGRVAKGNTVTILAEKDWWILEKEQSAAQKHGYQGCCQLTNVTLVSNDEGNTEFDKTWIEENTVKNIVENPIEEDITTILYKVTALVEKREGTGFTNYYFFDLDGETGTYTYTQCNGSDFAWVDEFDGKICTVYLTALNAKSSDSGCNYRLLPVAIEDEGFVFDTANAAKFAVEYYGVDQIEPLYSGDPALSLMASVSSEMLGFEGATLSYSSDNTAVVYFETVDGVTVMHCGEEGTANVTITGTYDEYTYSETVTVELKLPIVYDSITVADAIATDVDREVIVEGIVGPSVVNKNGFYLFGEDGSMIAVLVNSTQQFVGLEIGHMVVLKGMRERYVKNDASAIAGQTCIVNAEILANYYGDTAYSTEKFVTDKTLADVYGLDSTVDYSTTVFVVTATIEVKETAYYTNINIVSNGTTLGLYCSSAAQYAWLQAFAGQEVTMEIAACNWNDKNYWRGCVLAVLTEDGKVMNTLNFDTY